MQRWRLESKGPVSLMARSLIWLVGLGYESQEKRVRVRVSLDQNLKALHLSYLAYGSHKRSLGKEQ